MALEKLTTIFCSFFLLLFGQFFSGLFIHPDISFESSAIMSLNSVSPFQGSNSPAYSPRPYGLGSVISPAQRAGLC